MRDDLIPTNIENFIKLIENDKINVITWQNHAGKSIGYFLDYLISGNIDDLIDIYENTNPNLNQVSEVILSKSLLRYHEKINLILDNLNENNDLYWFKIFNYISTYKIHDTYNDYNIDYEIAKKQYINV
jgi:hypothetical protein